MINEKNSYKIQKSSLNKFMNTQNYDSRKPPSKEPKVTRFIDTFFKILEVNSLIIP